MPVDAVTIEVIRNVLIYGAEEMGVALRNSAYSPNIKERLDHSCALFDVQGQLLAQAEHIPVHLGSLAWGMKNVVRQLESVTYGPEDVFLLNDPYISGTHLNDFTMVAPVFWQDRLVGYSANKAHHVDVGGQTPGSLAISATELFQEGVVIPLVRLVRGGELVEDTWQTVLANVRNPEITRGDLRAQLAACSLGKRRIVEVFDRYGERAVREAWARIMDGDESLTRDRLRVMPPGECHAEDCLEAPDGSLLWIRVAIRGEQDRVVVDFSGTDAQVPFALNAVFGVATAATLYALKAALAPELPMTEGLLRVVHMTAPKGCLLNPNRPAPVGVGNTETSQRIADVVLKALTQVLPGRIPAAGCGSMNNVAIGGIHPATGQPWTFYETIGGGMGGRPDRDGVDGIHVNMTNTMNTPIEVMEREYPVLFREYEFRPASGGTGRWRGGCGIRRSWMLLGEKATVSILAERTVVPPWGLEGGQHGTVGVHVVIRADGREEVLPGKCTVDLRRGDTLVIQTPGGGGYGDPAERAPALIDQDRRNGLT